MSRKQLTGVDQNNQPLTNVLTPTSGGDAANKNYVDAAKSVTRTVGPAGTRADYITDGTADEVQIQAAIDDCIAAGGGTIYMRGGTYNLNARLDFGASAGGNVRLFGDGIGSTIWQFQGGTSETYMIVDNTDLHDITIEGITFDATGNQDAGLIVLQGTVRDINIRYNEFKNVDCPVTEKWPLKIGTVDLIAGSISAVNTTDNVLTVGVSIPTGTPILFENTGGALPGGLSATASYYAINDSSTTIKVAATAFDAFAGTPVVDLTDSGSGTNTFTAADYATSQSRRITIEHNRFTNNFPDTFEVILAVNMKDSWVLNNYFEGNTLNASDEVSFYPHHENTVYAGNIHNNSNAAAFGAKDSIGVKVHDNIFSYASNSGEAVNMRDTIESAVYDNLFIADRTSNTARAIGIEDTSGPAAYDGWPPFVQATRDLTIRGNKIYGYKYGIEGSLSSTNRDLDLKYVYIEDNNIDNVEVPIRFGTNVSNVDLKYWFVCGNRITNWRGTLLGAIHVIGYTTDPTLVNQIYVWDNYVAPRASGTNGGVRAVGATITEVRNNILTTSGSYGATSVANNGVITKTIGNEGVNDNPALSVANGGTGASTASGARTNLGAVNIAGDTMTGLLQFSGTTHAGLKLNSLTTTERNALTPANGMLIYNTTTNTMQKYENSSWQDISAGGGSGITSLNGQTGSTQTFTDDTNVTIASSANNHTLGWTGTLAVSRGGTGAGNAASARANLGAIDEATAIAYSVVL